MTNTTSSHEHDHASAMPPRCLRNVDNDLKLVGQKALSMIRKDFLGMAVGTFSINAFLAARAFEYSRKRSRRSIPGRDLRENVFRIESSQ